MQLLPDVPQVERRLPDGIRRAVEVVGGLAPVQLSLEQVVELKPELLCKLADLGVTLVDELAAVLRDLALGEDAAERPATAADAVGALVNRGDAAGLLQTVGSCQPGQARADHDDTRLRGAFRQRGELRERSDREGGQPGVPEELAPRSALLEHLVDLDTALVGLPSDGGRLT
jgi:hypothetical protein